MPSPDETDEARLANVSLSVHTEPREAAGIFTRAKPRLAVYSHIIPPDVTEAQLRAATPYQGPLTVAHDLMMITIGDRIDVADRPRAGAELRAVRRDQVSPAPVRQLEPAGARGAVEPRKSGLPAARRGEGR